MVGWSGLWLLATLALASALFPPILDSDDAHAVALKKAYQSWDSTKKVNHDIFTEPKSHQRAKRDAPALLGNANSACQVPGYTGQHCEFPICTDVNKNYTRPNVDGKVWSNSGTVSDLSSIAVVIDESMHYFDIYLTTTQECQPRFVLKDLQNRDIVAVLDDTQGTKTSIAQSYENVPAGTYYIVPSTLQPIIDGFQMLYQVSGPSVIQVNVGFVPWSRTSPQPERSDYPDSKVYQNELAVAVVKPHGLPRPGSLSTIAFYKDNVLVSRPMQLQLRYGCSYEYYFEAFFCRDPGHYVIQIDGVDFMGNNFRRISSVLCEVNTSTSPTLPPVTTPQPNVTACANGGTLITNKGQSTECFCSDYYRGQTCTTPICLHGGTESNNACLCKEGYTGTNCQNVQCIGDKGQDIFYNNPMLVLVVRISQSMNNVVGQLIDQLNNIKQLTTSDPTYLERIVVVTYTGQVNSINRFESFDNTIEFLRTQNSSTATTDSTCDDFTLSALKRALSQAVITYRSPVYVFTDTLPADAELVDDVFNRNSLYNAPIYFTLVQKTGVPDCDGIFDIYHTGYKALETIAKRSSGMVFVANQVDFGQLFYNHMISTFYRSHLIRSFDLPQCGSQHNWQALIVDDSFDNLHIVATGDGLSLNLVMPDGTPIAGDHPFLKALHTGSAYIWQFKGVQTGQWTFNIFSNSSSTACSYRAYSNNGFTSNGEDYRMFYAWTKHLVLDAPLPEPQWRDDSSLAVHLQGYGGIDHPVRPERVSAEVVIWAMHEDENEPELVFAANGQWRNNCSHQIFFPPFSCNHANEDLYFNVYVRSNTGKVIQRAGNAVCVRNQPTVTPPDGCQNGAAMVGTKCVCTPFWEGKHCEKRKCLNGGTPNGGVCECPAGHIGSSCEITACTNPNPEKDFSPVDRTMVFVIDTTVNNFFGVGQLHKYLPVIIRDMQSQNPDWITHIAIVGFNSQQAKYYYFNSAANTDAIGNALNKLANDMTTNNDSGCQVKTWDALKIALTSAGQNGYVFVFQGGIASIGGDDFPTIADAYETLVKKRIMLNTYLSVKDQNTYLCNGTDDDFMPLYEMSLYTEGETYGMLQSDFQHILRTIPTLYSSGLVVKRKIKDCSSKQMSFYIPIDSYTQTIQLTYFSSAPMKTALLYRPDGKPASDKILTHLLEDNVAGIHVDDIRKPCDPDWDFFAKNQMCLKKSAIPASWSEAQSICSSGGGYLVDDMFQEKNDYLGVYVQEDIWLGLNDLNRKAGSFAWDRGVNETGQPLSDNHYSKWAPNEPSTDPSLNCVARFKSDGLWHVTKCTQLRSFVCQKHKYSPDFTNNRIDGNDDLPVGKWRFDFQSEPTASGNPAGCMFEARVQSSIQVYTGFVTDEHADYPQDYPVSGSDQNRFITHLSGKNNPRFAPRLTYAMLYDMRNATFYNGLPYEKRDLCAYPFTSQRFECPNYQDPENAFSVIHTGEDENGIAFQRITSGHCQKARDSDSCYNGGIPWKGECVCPELFEGTLCEKPMCVNGGALNVVDGKCECPKGFTGMHCELGECYQRSNNYTTMKNDGKTFALVVENTQANKVALQMIAADLQNVIDAAQAATGSNETVWFSNFVLTLFDANGVHTTHTGIASQFIKNFKSLTANPSDALPVCEYPLFGSLTNAMSSSVFIKPGSVVYLISRGVPNDWNNMKMFADALSDSQAQLYWTIIKDNANCDAFNPNKAEYMMLSSHAYGSDGNVFYIPPDQLTIHMTRFIPAIYDSQMLSNPTYFKHTCEQLVDPVLVDQTMDALFITLHFDKYSSFAVTDTSGNEADMEKLYLDQDQEEIIYKVNTTGKPGLYTITINSSSTTCLVQIRGQHGAQVYTGFVYGEAEASHRDDPKRGPAMDATNTLVAHKDPLDGVLLSMEIVDVEKDNGFTTFRSPLYPRFGCSFEYYSKPFSCPGSQFFVVIFGVDPDGQTFRRVNLYECPDRGVAPNTTTVSPATPVVTPSPPVSTTTTPMTPLNTPFDVFLFIDVSSDVNKTVYDNSVINFVMNTFSTFSMARQGVQFSVWAIEGPDNHPENDPNPYWIKTLTNLENSDGLKASLKSLDNIDGVSQGQSLYEALNRQFLDKNAPADTAVRNKIAIYVTATEKPEQQAIDVAKQLRQSTTNKIGFISVAFPSDGSNKDALTQLSGGDACTFITDKEDTFHSFAGSIYDLIWKAATSATGDYC